MSFETEHFIKEIQNRPCIWNTHNEEYSNRILRQNAWNEIAEILNKDWLSLEENIKTKKVQELQKKWKGLRDYFNREKNKNSSLKSGRGARKKRKTPLLDMLQFLSVTKTTNQASSNVTDEDIITQEADTEDSQSSSTYTNTKTTKMTAFEEVLLQSMEKKQEEKREDDPDMCFLLNILPEMKSMTPSQNFEFRFEVMKVIKKIKYDDYYEHHPDQPECSYQYKYGYTSGTKTYHGLVNMQNSPTNSVASSIEDQKAKRNLNSDDKAD